MSENSGGFTMIKRRIERAAVTLLSAAVLLSSTGIASSLAANEIGTSGSTTAVSASAANSSTTVDFPTRRAPSIKSAVFP